MRTLTFIRSQDSEVFATTRSSASPTKRSTEVVCSPTEAVERYLRDFESVKFLSTKFDDADLISRIIRLSSSVVNQCLDLIPLDS